MRIFTLIAAVVVSLAANATDCFQDGMKWVVQYCSNPEGHLVFSKQTVTLDGDTIVDGVKALKMYEALDISDNIPALIGAIRADGDKISFWSERDEKWYQMYDFGLQPGAVTTVYIMNTRGYEKGPHEKTLRCKERKESTEFPGFTEITLEVYYEYSDTYSGEGVWIVGLGSTSGVLENCTFNYDGYGSWLLEAELNGQILYSAPQTGVEDVKAEDVKTVQVVNGALVAADPTVPVEVYSPDGICRHTGCLTSPLLLPTGIYIVRTGNESLKVKL